MNHSLSMFLAAGIVASTAGVGVADDAERAARVIASPAAPTKPTAQMSSSAGGKRPRDARRPVEVVASPAAPTKIRVPRDRARAAGIQRSVVAAPASPAKNIRIDAVEHQRGARQCERRRAWTLGSARPSHGRHVLAAPLLPEPALVEV